MMNEIVLMVVVGLIWGLGGFLVGYDIGCQTTLDKMRELILDKRKSNGLR